MTSTRLPGKVLADLAGEPVLAHMMKRVWRATHLDDVVVATTVNSTDDPIVSLCERLGVKTFRGEEHDVLARYQGAANAYQAEVVVRLTSDCPMIDPALIDQAIAMFSEGPWDYLSNGRKRSYPDGLDVQIFTRAALEEAFVSAKHPFAREHVTPYMSGRHDGVPSGDFEVGDLVFDADFSDLRWTIDTKEDLDRVRALVKLLPENYTWLQALSAAIHKPELLGINEDAGV